MNKDTKTTWWYIQAHHCQQWAQYVCSCHTTETKDISNSHGVAVQGPIPDIPYIDIACCSHMTNPSLPAPCRTRFGLLAHSQLFGRSQPAPMVTKLNAANKTPVKLIWKPWSENRPDDGKCYTHWWSTKVGESKLPHLDRWWEKLIRQLVVTIIELLLQNQHLLNFSWAHLSFFPPKSFSNQC